VFADERLTDIKLKLPPTVPNKDAVTPAEVESNLQGAGVGCARHLAKG